MSVIGIIQATEGYAISALKRDDYPEVIDCIRSLASLYNLLPAKIEVIPSDDTSCEWCGLGVATQIHGDHKYCSGCSGELLED